MKTNVHFLLLIAVVSLSAFNAHAGSNTLNFAKTKVATIDVDTSAQADVSITLDIIEKDL